MKVVDPVCGMNIDPAKAVGSSQFAGETWHFCSRGCEAKFDAAPANYIAKETVTAPQESCGTGNGCCN